MPTINLAPSAPNAGETSDAPAIANAFVQIQGAVNGLDNDNVANGANIAVSKLALPGTTNVWMRGDGAFTAPTVYAVLYQKTTTKDVVNTAAKTDLLNAEITIGASTLGANGAIEFFMGGDYLNNSGGARTISLELKLGTTVLWDSGTSATLAQAGVRRAWYFRGVIKAMGSTAAQRGAGLFFISDKVAPTTGTGTINDPSNVGQNAPFLTVAATENMTSSKAFTFSVTHSAANASLSMRLEHAFIKVIT